MTKKKASYKLTDKEKNSSKAFYVHDKPLIAHKSGNSTVVTLPSALSFSPGDEFDIEEVTEGLLLKPRKKSKTKDELRIERQLKQLHEIAGSYSTPGLEKMTTEELEELLEGVYD